MSAAPLLRVENLTVGFRRDGTTKRVPRPVVVGLDLTVGHGECVALVGQSGSGKSVTARSLLGLAGERSVVRASALALDGRDLRSLTPRQWRGVRGAQIGMVLQDALVSLDPLRPVGREIDDALRLHTRLGPVERRHRVLAALAAAGIPDPEVRADQRADELSGGLRQRALIASALVLEPPLIIADEPTTALDVTVQRQVLAALQELRDRGTGILLISHDLSVVSRVADRIAVMREGRIVETGSTSQVLTAPEHPYTRALLNAVPGRHPRGSELSMKPPGETPPVAPRTAATGDAVGVRPTARAGLQAAHAGDDAEGPLLRLSHVSRSFTGPHGTRTAVDDVSLTVAPGRTLGLVGESGSGKTTTVRIALGLTRPDSGEVSFLGRPWSRLAERDRRDSRHLLGAVYQDALSSFDPRWSVGALLTDALTYGATRSARRHADEVEDLLTVVGLTGDVMRRHPHSLSGGQRQRVAIARALAAQPLMLICDEPVSSLDVLVQAQVLDLFDELQHRFGLGYLFISHDLGVIRHMSDEVAVMKQGRIVESGSTEQLFGDAHHSAARELLSTNSAEG